MPKGKSKNPRMLYHYTSVQSLYGIVEGKKIWLNTTNNANDKEDSTFYFRLLDDLLDWENANIEVKRAYLDIKRIAVNEPRYFFSFSKLDDDASQWERYADNARGVSLCFQGGIKMDNFLHAQYPPVWILQKSLYFTYSTEMKIHIKKNPDGAWGTLIRLANAPNNQCVEQVLREAVFDNLEDFFENFYHQSVAYKQKSFQSESEFRIINLSQIPPEKISFNLVHNDIRKHFDLTVGENGLILEEIVLGPRNTTNELILRDFLDSRGFKNVKIRRSECTLR